MAKITLHDKASFSIQLPGKQISEGITFVIPDSQAYRLQLDPIVIGQPITGKPLAPGVVTVKYIETATGLEIGSGTVVISKVGEVDPADLPVAQRPTFLQVERLIDANIPSVPSAPSTPLTPSPSLTGSKNANGDWTFNYSRVDITTLINGFAPTNTLLKLNDNQNHYANESLASSGSWSLALTNFIPGTTYTLTVQASFIQFDLMAMTQHDGPVQASYTFTA